MSDHDGLMICGIPSKGGEQYARAIETLEAEAKRRGITGYTMHKVYNPYQGSWTIRIDPVSTQLAVEVQVAAATKTFETYMGMAITSASPIVPAHESKAVIGEDALQVGETLIDRIMFWLQVPILGQIVARRLTEKLDEISDGLERKKLSDHT